MRRTLRPARLRALLLATAGAIVVACADGGPTSGDDLATSLREQGNGGSLAIAGYVLQFSGSGSDSVPNDTLGALEPVPGALVQAIRLGDLPPDTSDSTGGGGDTTGTGGGDTTGTGGGDSTGTDSTRSDSSAARGVRARFASTTPDSGGSGGGSPLIPAQPDAQARTDRDGAYRLAGLTSGVYRVEVQRPGETRTFAWTLVALRDSTTGVTFRLPPRR